MVVEVCHDTIGCIVTRGRPGWWDVSRYNRLYRYRRKAWPLAVSLYNAAPRYGRGGCDTTRSSALGDTAHDTVCDMTKRKATIRPGEACDTAPGAPRHG